MNKKLITSLVAGTFFIIPAISLAVALIPPPGIIGSFGDIFNAIFNLLWPIFAAYSIIMFIIAGFQFLTARGDAAGAEKARQAFIYGSIGTALGILAFSIPFIIKFALGV